MRTRGAWVLLAGLAVACGGRLASEGNGSGGGAGGSSGGAGSSGSVSGSSGASSGGATSSGGGSGGASSGSASSSGASSSGGSSSGGGCAATCAGTCTGERCLETLATGQTTAVALAVDATSLYWSITGDCGTSDGSIQSIPTAGAASPTTLATGLASPGDVAVDGTTLYWAEMGCNVTAPDGSPGGRIAKIPVAGGAVVALATGRRTPRGLTASAGAVYWGELGGSLETVPETGGAPAAIAPFGPAGASVTSGPGYLFWLEAQGGGPSSVLALPIPVAPGGSSPITIATVGAGLVSQVRANATGVYWNESSSNLDQMDSVPHVGGTPALLAGQLAPVNGIAVDDSHVYVALSDGQSSSIARVPIAGGAVETLTETPEMAFSLVVDATSVYWIGANTGTIRKLSPK